MKISLKISLKKANVSDIEFLWYLRNRPDVYKYSRQNRPVSWKEHINWIFQILLGIDDKDLFLVKSPQAPIGQIRFDYKDQKIAVVSVSILKEFQGKGFATKSLQLAIKRVRKQKKIKSFQAEIHKENRASIKLFEKLHFRFKTKKRKWLTYILNSYKKTK